MKTSYDYRLTNGEQGAEEFVEEPILRAFLHDHKKTIESVIVTLEDGRRFSYERHLGWQEMDTPF